MLIQVANYIFPLIMLPYLMRVIGAEKYGMIAFAQALMGYVSVITDYGFNLTATREIAIARNDKKKIREIYNDVLLCKICIMCLCFVCLIVVGMFIPVFRAQMNFYLVAFLIVVGNVIFPIWFFQGIEQMKYITYVNLVSRTISVILLFISVQSADDYIFAIGVQGFGGVISGIIALSFIYSRFGLRVYRIPAIQQIMALIQEGRAIFIANACGNIYGQGATLITGIIAGNTAAGYYSLGQKISAMVVSVFQPIAQAIYPYLCQIFSKDNEHFLVLKKRILFFGAASSCILAFVLFFMADIMSLVITGRTEEGLVSVIKIFAFVTVGTILNVLLHPILLAMKQYSVIQKIYMKISTIFVLVSLPLVNYYGSQGMSTALILVEFYIFTRYVKQIFFNTMRGKS